MLVKQKMLKFGTGDKIQLNDKIATADDVAAFIYNERSQKSEAEWPYMTTSIKADVESSVGTISDIKLKLRDVNALKLSLSSRKVERLNNKYLFIIFKKGQSILIVLFFIQKEYL